jgi:GNAT superfamily N-acetyltransferase
LAITIRRVTRSDASQLTAILRSLGWFTHMTDEAPEATHERVYRHLEICMADNSHSVYVGEKDGNILGYISVHWLPYLILRGLEGYISELFIHECGRGQGVGTQLLEVVKKEGRERGCTRLMLINNRNRESYKRQFYEKNGWQERSEMANFVIIL